MESRAELKDNTSTSVFTSTVAVHARSSGSPVGPPVKVTICHNGHMLSVPEFAVSAHLAHGDTLGPCNSNNHGSKGNNGVGNGVDPQPPGNPPVNDAPGTGPGNPGH